MPEPSMESIVETLLTPHLLRLQYGKTPIMIMTCGLAGSGKTTIVKAIQAAHPSFHRLSIDAIIYQQHGIPCIDYKASSALYAQYQNEADDIYVATFRKLLAEKKNGILERSFYAREDRAEFRDMAERAGAKVLLVYLKAEGEVGKEVLWNRICKRSEETKTADSAVDISRETFEEYWSGFEEPVGEGEIVIRVS